MEKESLNVSVLSSIVEQFVAVSNNQLLLCENEFDGSNSALGYVHNTQSFVTLKHSCRSPPY